MAQEANSDNSVNCISVDLEEYYHAANLASAINRSSWPSLPARVVPSTEKVLAILAKHQVRATFFVLGYCARRHPQLIQQIAAAGHEIASHGYGHRCVYDQTPQQFRRDIILSKKLLQDICGKEVLGYRAPNFSITAQCPWAYEELVAAGYTYDSSHFPIWHPRYANLDKTLETSLIATRAGPLLEVPLAVVRISLLGKEFRLPVAGGGYWRHFPLWLNSWGLKKVQKSQHRFVAYLHPWELDQEQPKFSTLPWLTRLRHYGGINALPARLDAILGQFRFAPLIEILRQEHPQHFAGQVAHFEHQH